MDCGRRGRNSSAAVPRNPALGVSRRGSDVVEERAEVRAERRDCAKRDQGDQGHEQAVLDHCCAFVVANHRGEGG